MEAPELVILDVGHGNCALLRDTDGVVLIDCPSGVELPDTLSQMNITEISHVLISHADQDHIAGLPNLLLNSSVKVANIHLNSDWVRNTAIWEAVRRSLKLARQSFNVNIEAHLTTSTTAKLSVGQTSIEVLAPTPEFALTGIGGTDSAGKKIRANSMSAVISIGYGSQRSALLTGDLDQIGLDNLATEDVDLKAEVLVFPHHGGKPGPGANSKSFAQRLCGIVQPKLVIFSIDRSIHKNPDEEIVQGVLLATAETHIMCTQLSEKCAASLPNTNPNHLSNLPAKGIMDKKCCGGTILIKVGEGVNAYTPLLDAHENFVAQYSNSVCKRFSSSQQLLEQV